MRRKKSMLLVVLLMVVGFAAVSTTLYINGSTTITANQADFNVYYSDALVNGVQDLTVITDDTHISFTTSLATLGEKYVLDYEVTNGSKNYDAQLAMTCTAGNDYLSVTNEFDDSEVLEALKTRNGKLTLELTKSYVGESDLEVTVDCTITGNAIERESLGVAGPIAFVPKYFEHGTPTTLSTTDYTTVGYNVFAGLDDDNSIGVCLVDNGLYCAKVNDTENTMASMKEYFGEGNCTTNDNNDLNCQSDSYTCEVYNDGGVYCSSTGGTSGACGIDSSGEVFCY